MASSVVSLEVTNDHAVPVTPQGGVSTVLSQSGDTLYYADNAQVSAASNQGTLTAGLSKAFTTPAWIRSASLTTVTVTTTTLPAETVPGVILVDPTVANGSIDQTAYLTALV